ncbi:MAG: hypothetical protein EAX86_02470 [Candidatus Heimdallarchaeota archaeon]|nr:hypothetical protein [Candidatus Heimdallarchaeota archaeon]
MLLYWIDKKRFAGSNSPSIEDFPFLKCFEWGGLICLESEPLSEEISLLLDVPFCHIPIADFSPPSHEDLEQILEFYNYCQEMRPNFPLLIHCSAGQGRTGTILASLLVLLDNQDPIKAINMIRNVNPFAIETKEQEEFIMHLK